MPQPTLHTRIADAIRDQSLARPGDRLIVAVSGGADSVALLDLLSTSPYYSFRLIVAHLNHLLRGPESDADERFVIELATQYGLPCEVSRTDVRNLARQCRLSLEEAGRKARYAFFEELRQRHQAAAIAVAHHADDQAETFLLRLLRGSGASGLTAMAPRTAHDVIRPLLSISRAELLDYLKSRGLVFREDKSNQDRNFLRNRVRHDLLPRMKEYNPAIVERLTATAGLLADDEQLLEQLTSQCWEQLGDHDTGWAALNRQPLEKQPTGLRLRLYRHAITRTSGSLSRIERKHCLAIDQLVLNGQTGGQIALPKGLAALLTSEHLLIARRDLLHPSPPATLTIDKPGSYDLGNGLSLLVELATPPRDWSSLPAHICFIDQQQVPFPWHLRPARANDRLELLGMSGSRLVRDILVDIKLPRHLRQSLPLLLHNEKPLWLAPVRRTRLGLLPSDRNDGMRLTLVNQKHLPLFP